MRVAGKRSENNGHLPGRAFISESYWAGHGRCPAAGRTYPILHGSAARIGSCASALPAVVKDVVAIGLGRTAASGETCARPYTGRATPTRAAATAPDAATATATGATHRAGCCTAIATARRPARREDPRCCATMTALQSATGAACGRIGAARATSTVNDLRRSFAVVGRTAATILPIRPTPATAATSGTAFARAAA